MRGRVWHHTDHPVIWVVPVRGFTAVLGNSVLMCFGCAASEACHLFLDVTLSGGAVTSCVTSRPRMCTGHMTFCYKRRADASFEALLALGLWFVHSSGSPLPPTYGWCLTRVGHDTSPGWSLLPSSVIIVLALVNSAASPEGTSGISTRPGSVVPLPVSAASTELLCLSVGARVHHGRSITKVECVVTTLCISHSVRDIYM